jgi:energy-coupling factor transporter ATP-binding protein EcfA2
VDVDRVTALIGTNESGKTNLLLPLWKLNPASGGEIKPTADYPRKRYNVIRTAPSKPVFIEAHFELDDELARELSALTGSPPEFFGSALVARDFAGKLHISFPHSDPVRRVHASRLFDVLTSAEAEVEAAPLIKAEEPLKAAMLAACVAARNALAAEGVVADGDVAGGMLKATHSTLEAVDLGQAAKRSSISPAFGRAADAVAELVAEVSVPHPNDNADARALVQARMPKFVYYSNYGNLDSEIYLPHVIDNMERKDLGSKEEAKVRTLKVLFDFVRLKPQEVLDLGRDIPPGRYSVEPTTAQIEAVAENKKQRSILMQSAGSELTERFRDWWRQGEYRFRFEADGDHFRIWVSDQRRPEEVELEGRSTGLQWFLSFYLIFLVESQDAHQGAILLLDEPGLSLHPLAQRDLSQFFDSLSKQNQLLYTTHSPFLVDPDHLDRVKAVYVLENGTTAVSADLRAGESHSAQGKSIYPVWAALGLTVSDTMLQGAQPLLVEGTSDQHYLGAIKALLIGAGRIQPRREIVFVPTGGVKGLRATAAILASGEDEPPFALLDADGPGIKLAQQIKGDLYQGHADRLLSMSEFVPDVPGAEVEDLIPLDVITYVVRRWIRAEEEFDDIVQSGIPVVGQIEAYAARFGLALELGWKVELAKRVKARLLQRGISEVSEDILLRWTALFGRLSETSTPTPV